MEEGAGDGIVHINSLLLVCGAGLLFSLSPFLRDLWSLCDRGHCYLSALYARVEISQPEGKDKALKKKKKTP